MNEMRLIPLRRGGVRAGIMLILVLAAAAIVIGVSVSRQGGSGGNTTPPRNSRPDDGPAVSFEPPAVDFGDIAPNVTATETVRIVNHTAEQVRLASIQSSCECLVATTQTDRIPPGGTIDLRLELSASSRQNQQASHEIALQMLGAQTITELDVRVRIINVFDLKRIEVAAGDPPQVRVTSVDGSDFFIARTPFFVQSAQPVDGSDERATEFVLTLDAEAQETDENALETLLVLNHRDHGNIIIDWVLRNDAATRFDPPDVPLPQVYPTPMNAGVAVDDLAEGATTEVELVGLRPNQVENISIRVAGDRDLDVAIEATEPITRGIRYTLSVTGDPERFAGAVVMFLFDERPLASVRLVPMRGG